MTTQPQRPAPSVAEAVAVALEAVAPLLEASAGYRKQAEAAGFSPETADRMAGEFHATMLRLAFSKAGG